MDELAHDSDAWDCHVPNAAPRERHAPGDAVAPAAPGDEYLAGIITSEPAFKRGNRYGLPLVFGSSVPHARQPGGPALEHITMGPP